MKKLIFASLLLLLISCGKTEEEKAAPLLSQIEKLYGKGCYQQALDSILSLRQHFPQAIEARRKALKIWQDASLKITQDDIAKTDSALQATQMEMKSATNLYRRNMLGVKRDSLQARYDGLCGTVRVIHKKQRE
jgi:hypothetical protein